VDGNQRWRDRLDHTTTTSTPSASSTGEAGDYDFEECGDATDDGFKAAGDTGDNGFETTAYCAEEVFDAGDDGTHFGW